MRVQPAGQHDVRPPGVHVRGGHGGEHGQTDLQEHHHGVLLGLCVVAAGGRESGPDDGRDQRRADGADGQAGGDHSRHEPAGRDVREADDLRAQGLLLS